MMLITDYAKWRMIGSFYEGFPFCLNLSVPPEGDDKRVLEISPYDFLLDGARLNKTEDCSTPQDYIKVRIVTNPLTIWIVCS